MIELRVEKYCHNCEHFNPEVTKFRDISSIRVCQQVYCVNSSKCQEMYKYIRGEFMKEKTDA